MASSLATRWSPEAFDAEVQQAVENAEVGFHFEEGGCWGFAAALFEHLQVLGLHPHMEYQPTGFVHAWVRVGADRFDHQGVMRAPASSKPVSSVDDMRQLALANGIDADAFYADVSQAKEIIQSALACAGASELP